MLKTGANLQISIWNALVVVRAKPFSRGMCGVHKTHRPYKTSLPQMQSPDRARSTSSLGPENNMNRVACWKEKVNRTSAVFRYRTTVARQPEQSFLWQLPLLAPL